MFNPQLDELDPYIIERGTIEVRPNFSGITWKKVNMINLKKGDIFRALKSQDNKSIRVEHKNGKTEFVSTSDGYIDPILKIPVVNISK